MTDSKLNIRANKLPEFGVLVVPEANIVPAPSVTRLLASSFIYSTRYFSAASAAAVVRLGCLAILEQVSRTRFTHKHKQSGNSASDIITYSITWIVVCMCMHMFRAILTDIETLRHVAVRLQRKRVVVLVGHKLANAPNEAIRHRQLSRQPGDVADATEKDRLAERDPREQALRAEMRRKCGEGGKEKVEHVNICGRRMFGEHFGSFFDGVEFVEKNPFPE